MTSQEAEKKIASLVDEIARHDHLYHVEDQPVISDSEYDALLRELRSLEEQFPQFRLPQSPTQRDGAKVADGARTIRHPVKMFSLDNTYSVEEIAEWVARVRKVLGDDDIGFSVEPKIDGVSVTLVYEKGLLLYGATRGDGETGEDVTHNVRAVRSIPLALTGNDLPDLVEVRGEVYMNRADLAALNAGREAEGLEIFVNPRNAASGSLKLQDPSESSRRKLRFFAHSFGRFEPQAKAPVRHGMFFQMVRGFGVPVNPLAHLCRGVTEVEAVCEEWGRMRRDLPYDIDGVVIKVDDFRQRVRLGETMKSPRWAVAFKFPADQATTRVRDIVTQVGRTGVLTPVAELEPVVCGGVTISRATVHNFDEAARLGIHVGARVLIERAGDVIPKIVKVVAEAEVRRPLPRVPTDCPACREEFICQAEGDVSPRCINPACPRQLERRLLHFGSKGAMDIDGFGESVAHELVERKIVGDVADLYMIRMEQLLSVPLFAQKKADNLLRAIQESKERPLSRLIFALGIANIGERAAQNLAERFRTMEALMGASREEV
ncbi:MAG: NAD-dependent DNA ligase LigA, partial [Elusimicrobia bacterium]|nr:NAD-dependent DNA ligase LigA [Elusimicrobiota bacterium]